MEYLTALSQFVSQLGECGLLLYKLLKKFDSFPLVGRGAKGTR
jgi:hypothetical protein